MRGGACPASGPSWRCCPARRRTARPRVRLPGALDHPVRVQPLEGRGVALPREGGEGQVGAAPAPVQEGAQGGAGHGEEEGHLALGQQRRPVVGAEQLLPLPRLEQAAPVLGHGEVGLVAAQHLGAVADGAGAVVADPLPAEEVGLVPHQDAGAGGRDPGGGHLPRLHGGALAGGVGEGVPRPAAVAPLGGGLAQPGALQEGAVVGDGHQVAPGLVGDPGDGALEREDGVEQALGKRPQVEAVALGQGGHVRDEALQVGGVVRLPDGVEHRPGRHRRLELVRVGVGVGVDLHLDPGEPLLERPDEQVLVVLGHPLAEPRPVLDRDRGLPGGGRLGRAAPGLAGRREETRPHPRRRGQHPAPPPTTSLLASRRTVHLGTSLPCTVARPGVWHTVRLRHHRRPALWGHPPIEKGRWRRTARIPCRAEGEDREQPGQPGQPGQPVWAPRPARVRGDRGAGAGGGGCWAPSTGTVDAGGAGSAPRSDVPAGGRRNGATERGRAERDGSGARGRHRGAVAGRLRRGRDHTQHRRGARRRHAVPAQLHRLRPPDGPRPRPAAGRPRGRAGGAGRVRAGPRL